MSGVAQSIGKPFPARHSFLSTGSSVLCSAYTPKTLVLKGFRALEAFPTINGAFGGVHASWLIAGDYAAGDSMETLPVQSADVATPTPTASTLLESTPAGGDTFAATLGRAIDNIPDSAPDGSSVTPKVSSRAKGATDSNADSTSMAGVLFNCFVTNLVQPTPAVALSTEGVDSPGSQTPESPSGSLPNLPSSFSTAAGDTGSNSGTLAGTMRGVAAPGASSAWMGQAVIPAASSKTDSSRSNVRARDQVANQTAGLLSPAGQSQSQDTPFPASVNAQIWAPGLPNITTISQPAAQNAGGVQSPSQDVQSASSRVSDLASGASPVLQVSPSFANSSSALQQLDPGQSPLVSLGQTESATPPAGQAARDPSTPTLSLSPAEISVPSASKDASNPSTLPSAADRSKIAEHSNLLGKSGEIPSEGSVAATTGVLTIGSRTNSADSVRTSDSAKSENLIAGPMNGTIHYTQVSSSAPTDSTWQKGNDPVANPPASNPAAAAPLQQPDANSQSGTPATASQKDVVSEARGIQTSGTVYASSGETAGNSSLSDSSANGQGKSGQQSGPGSGDSPSGIKPSASGIANSPVVDSSANLLTAHTPTLPANHTIASAPHTLPSASSNQPSATLSAWQNYDGGTGKIVRSASINDSAGGAEMHVELRSGALGPLEVHAVVREGSVGAEIHVQGQEAHTLLSAGLPSLERALGERNLRVENIAVYQDHAGGGMTGGERQGQHSDSSPSQQHQVLPWDSPPQSRTAAGSSLEGEELASTAAGLSVRA